MLYRAEYLNRKDDSETMSNIAAMRTQDEFVIPYFIATGYIFDAEDCLTKANQHLWY